LVTDYPTVASRLNGEIAAGRLEADSAQREAAVKLDALSAALANGSESVADKFRARLRRLSLPAGAGPVTPHGIYLWGGVGRGKTLMMDWFYESLRVPRRERTHFYRFMQRVHAELRMVSQRSEPLQIVAQKIADQVQIICLDEFFVSDIADAMLLSGLFEGLFKRGVVLVTTSNVPPRDLYKDGLQRQRFLPAIELIEAHVDVVHLDSGIDYRLRQLEQAPTYFDSTQAQTPARMQQLFVALAGAQPKGPTLLSIEGRTISAMACASEMVWFEFADLCEGPRSQNDYIELARSYHTIFVSNIPKFTRHNENAARRFIMLIDELYDRGVKIVVSAVDPADSLYHGERLQFEFQRAASRLIEMQTQQYLAGQHRP
jgi:cell division protein ZapE